MSAETTTESAIPDDVLFRLDDLEKYFAEGDWVTSLLPGRSPTQVRAVDGVSLDIREGETVGLVGESGCGKSTLARAALRLLDPTGGVVSYEGTDITEYDDDELRAFRGEAQMIFQDPFASLNPRYTVRKTLVEPMKVHDVGDTKEERIDRAGELLEKVGLARDMLDRHPHEFSGGQRQRVAIARALAVEPKLIVADEPTSALDVSVQAKILNLLDDLREEMGLTMLFISHDLSVIRRITDRVAVMYLGEIVETADTDDLFREPEHPYSQALLSSIPVPDPTVERERIPLEGDVPTPIDPPTGCRFHPRCPRVIPTDDWSGTQDEWRRLLQFKARLRNEGIDVDAVRDQLEAQDEATDDEAVREALYEEYIERADVTDATQVELPEPARSDVQEAINLLVEEGNDAAGDRLDEKYTSVCESDVPREVTVGDDDSRRVVCHRYDDDKPGSREGGPSGSIHDVDAEGGA
ncbi:MAG: ABC transporter ATP-binding protein [Halolamina sp.]